LAHQPIPKHGLIRDISDTDSAYIAGLIDADGTVTASHNKGKLPAPMVLVVNGSLPLIQWLQETIGAGCAYETKTRPTRPDQNDAHWNKVHRYQITGWKAQSLIARVRPFMRVKAAQADMLQLLAQRGRDFPRSATEAQRSRSLWALENLRALNIRGKKPEHQFAMAV
jgi:hypothetical protein